MLGLALVSYLCVLVLYTHSIYQVGDVTWYKRATWALLRGEQIYALHPRGVVYPPLYYALLAPIAAITEFYQFLSIGNLSAGPIRITRAFDLFLLVYSVLSVSTLGVIAAMGQQRLAAPSYRRRWLGFLLATPWVLYAIPLLGQATWLVLASLVIGAFAYADGRDRLSGFAFGLAACVKIFPGFGLLALVIARPERRSDLILGAIIPVVVTVLLFSALLPGSLSAFLNPSHMFGIAQRSTVAGWVILQLTGLDLSVLPLTVLAAVAGVILAVKLNLDTDLERALIPIIFVLAADTAIVNYRWVSVAALAMLVGFSDSRARGLWYQYAVALVALGSAWALGKVAFDFLTARRYGLVGTFPKMDPPMSPEFLPVDMLSGEVPMATALLNTVLIGILVYRLSRKKDNKQESLPHPVLLVGLFIGFLIVVRVLVTG